MLRFERQAIAEVIYRAAFADVAAVEEIAGIKLEARLSSRDLQRATTGRFDYARRQYQRVCGNPAAIQHPIMIVAVAIADLGVVSVIYSRSDRGGRPEIERRALHGNDLTRR